MTKSNVTSLCPALNERPEDVTLSRLPDSSITPTRALSALMSSVIKYSHAIGCERLSLSRKDHTTINSPMPNNHKYNAVLNTRFHCQTRAVLQASQALPRHQPPIVMVMKAVTFQAKTGANCAGRRKSKIPRTA